MHGCIVIRAPLASVVESAHCCVFRSLKAPLTRSHNCPASDESHAFVVTLAPDAPPASVARQLPVELTFTLPELGSTLHCWGGPFQHQYRAAELNGPPASTQSPELVGPGVPMFL